MRVSRRSPYYNPAFPLLPNVFSMIVVYSYCSISTWTHRRVKYILVQRILPMVYIVLEFLSISSAVDGATLQGLGCPSPGIIMHINHRVYLHISINVYIDIRKSILGAHLEGGIRLKYTLAGSSSDLLLSNSLL